MLSTPTRASVQVIMIKTKSKAGMHTALPEQVGNDVKGHWQQSDPLTLPP